jgi:hypothetical protein
MSTTTMKTATAKWQTAKPKVLYFAIVAHA